MKRAAEAIQRVQALMRAPLTPVSREAVVDNLPLISCICPTYGRAPDYQHLLEEAIESFLRQTYPSKELIVLNDSPEQELVCDAPGVRVINVSERFPTLGEKYNAAIALARGDLIAPWEDDDISLSWRLSLSIERLGDAGYFNPKRYWFLDGNGFHADHPMGYGHNLSLFTRAAFETVGGYPAISGPQDAAMDGALRSTVRWVGPGVPVPDELPTSEWYYIYRWGVSPAHLSAFASPERDFYTEFGERPIQSGRFVLLPHWRRDYEAEIRRILEVAAHQLLPTNPTEGLSGIETEQVAGPIRRIITATYGSGEDRVDVTARVQELVRDGQLNLTVSNTLFGDPCPNRLKTLRLTYEQQHQLEIDEHQHLSLELGTGSYRGAVFDQANPQELPQKSPASDQS
jgi:hypothetical protein